MSEAPRPRAESNVEAAADVGTRHASAEASPGFALWRVATVWQREIRAALAELDLTHAQFVLLASAAWLIAHPDDATEPVTQAHVAAHARTDAVMTSEVLRTLERKKLIRRLPHPGDARAKQIALTPAGKRLAGRAFAAVEAVDDDFFGEPGPELRALTRLLCRPASPGD
jgi:DNA-binding MarR family transcriptional regulator